MQLVAHTMNKPRFVSKRPAKRQDPWSERRTQGYRASWDGAVGKVAADVLSDNEKAWSGDHCVDPVLVPGVLFSNRQIQAENPGIEDLAPTVLHLFGMDAPAWMDGRRVL